MSARWQDGTRKSTHTAFTLGYGADPIEWERMESVQRSRAASIRRVREANERGENPGKVPGLSRRADAHTRDGYIPQTMKARP